MAKKERITLDALYKDVANLDIKNIQVEVERDGPNLILPPGTASWFKPDSTGRLRALVDTSGRVTETSAASSNAYLLATAYGVNQPTFGDPGATGAAQLRSHHKWAFVALTEAGGSIAATEIVPALAGYTSHAEIYGIWCPAGTTDAANTWTFAISGGTLLGPAVWTMNITASLFHWFTAGAANIDGVPFPLRGTAAAAADDNKAMTVSAAGLAVVGTTYYILLKYWYET